MQKIVNYIFNCSPKKLAIYLVLGPLALFLAHTILTIIIRVLSNANNSNTIIASVIATIIILFLTVIIIIWFSWIYGIVKTTEEKLLGISIKWFRIAFYVLCFFILFNIATTAIEYLISKGVFGDTKIYLVYASREFVNFGGILIAYPIICHYAARAIYVKQNNQKATLGKTISVTLLLIFGTVISIPFLHAYFTNKSSTTKQITSIYGLALGLCVVLFIIGFIAAVTGLI